MFLIIFTGIPEGREVWVSIKSYYGTCESEFSQEDSDIPFAGAVPWHTQNATSIINAVRSLLGITEGGGDLWVQGPDGYVYNEWFGRIRVANVLSSGDAMFTSGEIVPNSVDREMERDALYYRVVLNDRNVPSRGGYIGVRGAFYLPNPDAASMHPDICNPSSSQRAGELKPHIYLGNRTVTRTDSSGKKRVLIPEVDVGIMFHPAGWAWDQRTRSWVQREVPARWQVFLRISAVGYINPNPAEITPAMRYRGRQHVPLDAQLADLFFGVDSTAGRYIFAPGAYNMGNIVYMEYVVPVRQSGNQTISPRLVVGRVEASNAFGLYYRQVLISYVRIPVKFSVAGGDIPLRLKRVHSIDKRSRGVQTQGIYVRNIIWGVNAFIPPWNDSGTGKLLGRSGWVEWRQEPGMEAVAEIANAYQNSVFFRNRQLWFTEVVDLVYER